MSIYSGFATRQQEQMYDTYTEKMLILLQKLVYELLGQEKPSDKFCNSFEKIYTNMKRMEESKYLKPKLTDCLQPLVKICFDDDLLSKEINLSEIRINRKYHFPIEKPVFSEQKALMIDFMAENHDKSTSFKTNRPHTTRRISIPYKSKSTLSKPKYGEEIEEKERSISYYNNNSFKQGTPKHQHSIIKEKKKPKRSFADVYINKTLKH